MNRARELLEATNFNDCKAGGYLYANKTIWKVVPSGTVMPSWAPEMPVLKCIASEELKAGEIQIDYFNSSFRYLCHGDKEFNELTEKNNAIHKS